MPPVVRRPSLSLLPVLVAVAGVLSCSRGTSPDGPRVRNVVLILVDTLRPDHLGAYGYGRPTSPAIDALAARGVVFENAFAQAPWTTPSIASLLGGLYPSAMDMGFWSDPGGPGRVADAVETLAEVVRAGGVRTHAITARGGTNAEFGFGQGFEEYDDDAGYVQLTLERAEAFLDGLDDDERFFLYLHTYDVHNFNPPGEYREMFVEPYRGDLLPKERLNKFLQGGTTRLEARSFGEAEWRHVKSLYDACIRNVDDQIARLVETLRASGRLDDTLILVTADHGEEFGEHGSSGHGYAMYDESIRVPLILAHPSLAPARVAPQVRLLDVAPTLAALLGLAPSETWQGSDLSPLLEGRALSLPVFVECAHNSLKAMRVESPRPRKLIVGQGRPKGHLFALDVDPDETKTRHQDPDEREVLAAMKEAMLRWVRTNARLAERFTGREGEEDGMSDEAREEMEAFGYVGAGKKGGGRGEFDWEAALSGG